MRQKLVNCIRDQNYGELISLLQMDGSMTGQGLFSLAKMTGLEWAVYWEDWRMTAIFFVFGADPQHNIFDGIMEMPPGYVPLPGFSGQPIPGFDGLLLLLREEDDIEYGVAYLSVMEVCYNGALDVRHELGPLLRDMHVVREDLRIVDMKDRIMTTLLALRRMGLPNEVAVRIVGDMVVATLWDAIKVHAFTETPPTGELPWKGLVQGSVAALSA